MTEKILNSLYVQNMFLYMNNEEIISSLESKEDKVKFIEAVVDILRGNRFFQVKCCDSRDLVIVLNFISSSEEWNKDEKESINKLIDTATSIVNFNTDTKDFNAISYGTSEAKKRNLNTGNLCVPSSSEIYDYLNTDYVILNALVKENKVISDEYDTNRILSALQLMLSDYSALLFENPNIEETVKAYLSSFDVESKFNKVFHHNLVKRICKLKEDIFDFDLTKDLAIQVNKELCKDGYILKKGI